MRLGLVTGYSGPKMQHTMEVILICISRAGRQKRKMPCSDELVDAVALVGPKERIAEQLTRWKASPVTTMIIGTNQVEALRTLAELCL